MQRPLLCVISCLALVACETTPKSSLSGAQNAYRAASYSESLRMAKDCVLHSTGIARDEASYLEGLSLLRQAQPQASLAPLRAASNSVDQQLAANASISLGSACIALEEFGDAGRAYATAADLLDGEESNRAHATAARCFARAGLSVESAREHADAGAPERESAVVPPTVVAGNGFGEVPLTVVPPTPIRLPFALQAGAFRDRSKAESIARGLSSNAKRLGLAAPEVVQRVAKDGSVLFAVQVGEFLSRADAIVARTKLKTVGATVVER